jgi:hypothetical protein
MREDATNEEEAKRRDRRSNCTDEFEYFSLRLSSLPSDLSAAAAPLVDPLRVTSFPSTAHQSNLWVGRSGIQTAGHFDLQFNFFVQLEGKKQFTLFAPSAPLRLFPNTHPHQAHTWPVEEPTLQARQKQPSQTHSSPLAADESDEEEAEEAANRLPSPKSCEGFVPLDSDEADARPLHTGSSQKHSPPPSLIRRYVADLSSGDVLLVPPLWFHSVTTVSRSVSVNVWSDAPEYTLLQDELYALPLPLESEWTERARVSALLYYLRRLILAVSQQGESGLQRSRGTKAERVKTALWLQWTTRWITAQRFHRPLVDQLIRRAERAPRTEQQNAFWEAILFDCCMPVDGAEGAAQYAVEQWQTEEHQARWLRGITPTVQLFERIREAARPVDLTRSHTTDGDDDAGASAASRSTVDADASSMDPSVADQSDAIVSLLLANYVEWAMMAVLGGGTNGDARTMIDFVQCCFMRGDELKGEEEEA